MLSLKPWSHSGFRSDSHMTPHLQLIRHPAGVAFMLYWEFSHLCAPPLCHSGWALLSLIGLVQEPPNFSDSHLTYLQSSLYIETGPNCIKFSWEHVIPPHKILQRLPFLNRVKSKILSVTYNKALSHLCLGPLASGPWPMPFSLHRMLLPKTSVWLSLFQFLQGSVQISFYQRDCPWTLTVQWQPSTLTFWNLLTTLPWFIFPWYLSPANIHIHSYLLVMVCPFLTRIQATRGQEPLFFFSLL